MKYIDNKTKPTIRIHLLDKGQGQGGHGGHVGSGGSGGPGDQMWIDNNAENFLKSLII